MHRPGGDAAWGSTWVRRGVLAHPCHDARPRDDGRARLASSVGFGHVRPVRGAAPARIGRRPGGQSSMRPPRARLGEMRRYRLTPGGRERGAAAKGARRRTCAFWVTTLCLVGGRFSSPPYPSAASQSPHRPKRRWDDASTTSIPTPKPKRTWLFLSSCRLSVPRVAEPF